jgi:hypothetical protein
MVDESLKIYEKSSGKSWEKLRKVCATLAGQAVASWVASWYDYSAL